jgi:hypothetical protein
MDKADPALGEVGFAPGDGLLIELIKVVQVRRHNFENSIKRKKKPCVFFFKKKPLIEEALLQKDPLMVFFKKGVIL